MKKNFFTLLILCVTCYASFARHIAGGEIFHEYLGPGVLPGTSQYKITLRLFRDCHSTGAPIDPTIAIAIFDKQGNLPVSGSPFTVNLDHISVIQKSGSIPCIINAPDVCYQTGYYFLTVTLPNSPQGYWITFQRCCRIDNIANLAFPVGTGATYVGSIAGTIDLGAGHNSSPVFNVKDTALVCQNRNFKLDFGAVDPDGDQLTYEFCEAYNGGTEGSPTVANPPPPPYQVVPYRTGFSAFSPLGAGVTINPSSGLISGIAPVAGAYVIAVCITEWRNGKIINTHRKDFILQIADCDFVAAMLPLSATYCDDFTTSFENLTPSSLIYSWHWDFGVSGSSADTSNLPTPVFTYADTGIYTVKLVVNPGDPCTDSATMKLGVFPGFFPDFSSTGICVTKPTQFTDLTTTRYGTVNAWRWNFGEATAVNDTSVIKNPVYSYPSVGTKPVQLIVSSSKGCVDTVMRDITIIDKPPISLPFRDTVICSVDTLQIPAGGSGIFSWTPDSQILFANTAAPLVFPQSTRWYKVELDDNGCKNQDSVLVRVVGSVQLTARKDTTICKGDDVFLSAVSDGLQFFWTPTFTLSNPAVINPVASPSSTTTYQITARIGGCSATDEVTVFVVPYPFVDAGADISTCFKMPVQLNGNVTAADFFWKPQGSLSDSKTLNPVATPAVTTKYILTATDTLGCPKAVTDSVLVTVLPKVNASAGRDTAIVQGQALQLTASGGEHYFWSPSLGLNNVNTPTPIVKLTAELDSIRYNVYVTDKNGCLDSASLLVKVFRTNPRIFVPTGFTPNGDGINDLLRPIAVGIERIDYFRVYNRWGQLVFSTTTNGMGWDGKIAGKNQASGTYAWLVKGVDYTGKTIYQKGTTTLIR